MLESNKEAACPGHRLIHLKQNLYFKISRYTNIALFIFFSLLCLLLDVTKFSIFKVLPIL